MRVTNINHTIYLQVMEQIKPKYERILIAVDDTECSKKAVDHATYFASMPGARLALVHVTENPTPSNYGVDPLMGQQAIIVPESMHIQETAALQLLEEMKYELESSSTIKEIACFHRTGTPRQEILAVSQEWEADLIVMGTHGRTGFDHFISGSVSESVLRRATCPVLVVPSKC